MPLTALRRLPILVLLLLAADVALAVAPLLDAWVGQPFRRLTNFLNPDGENTLPTWYSSMQWFSAGALFALFAIYAAWQRLRGMLSVAALAFACLAFSIDEIAEIHEQLGMTSDALFSSGTRHGTAFWSTGLWPFVIGVPVVVALGVVVRGMRTLFTERAPAALRLLIAGLVIMFTGALAVELGSNLVADGAGRTGAELLQVVLEEFLEMLGVTFIVWSACELLGAYGFALKLPERVPAQSRSPLSSEADAPVPAYTPARQP